MIKVTLEFHTVDEAIVGLSKLVGVALSKAATGSAVEPSTPAARTRKGRNDKGQSRGPHKTPDAPINANATVQAGTRNPVGSGVAAAGTTSVTDPSNAGTSATLTSTPDNVPAVAPKTAASASIVSSVENQGAIPAGTPAAAAPKQEDAQAAISKLFEGKGLPTCMAVLSRHGVNTIRELKPEQYAQFIEDCKRVLDGGDV